MSRVGKDRKINLRNGRRIIMRKMIFFDIDGTISNEQTGEIPESAIRAIRKARENGHKCGKPTILKEHKN